MVRTRPYRRLGHHLIVKNEEENIFLAVKPLLPIVNQRIIQYAWFHWHEVLHRAGLKQPHALALGCRVEAV